MPTSSIPKHASARLLTWTWIYAVCGFEFLAKLLAAVSIGDFVAENAVGAYLARAAHVPFAVDRRERMFWRREAYRARARKVRRRLIRL